MNMINNKFTPSLIVEEGKEFSIPLYQRLFSWKGKDVEKLLWDMKEHFERTPNAPYYFGLLTCVEQNGIELLIDGQQRMTVMLLMAIALRKYYEGWNGFLDNGNRIDFVARSDDREYIRWIIKSDEWIEGKGDAWIKEQKDKGFRTLRRRAEQEGNNVYENDNMWMAMNSIYDFLRDCEINKKHFSEKVYRNLTFFISRLPEDYSNNPILLNKYFESMNSQGRGLEQHEILKVELLKGSGDDGTLTQIWNAVSQMDKMIIKDREQDIDSYRGEYIMAIEDWQKEVDNTEWVKSLLGGKSEDVGSESIEDIEEGRHNFNVFVRDEGTDGIVTFEEFLLLVLDISMGRVGMESSVFYKTDKLLERFQILINSDTEKRKNFYWDLLFYRLLLDYYVIRREFKSGDEDNKIRGSYTLLVKDDGEEGNDNNRTASTNLRQFQSMLYVSTEFYDWLKPFLEELKKGELSNASQMLEWLKGEDNERHREKDMHPISYPHIKRYWFWRLDYYLWENRKYIFDGEFLKVANNYVFRRNRSIEHIVPQNPKTTSTLEWLDRIEEDCFERISIEDKGRINGMIEKEDFQWDRLDNRDKRIADGIIRNSFGNLAMISSGLNSSLSNESYGVKMERVISHCNGSDSGSIESLNLLWIYKTYVRWNETTFRKNIIEHGRLMRRFLEVTFDKKEMQRFMDEIGDGSE